MGAEKGETGTSCGKDTINPILIRVVEETIGFVDDEKLQVLEIKTNGFVEMINKTTRSGDENVCGIRTQEKRLF